MSYVFMALIVMVCIVMAYVFMDYIVMVYIVMAYVFVAYIVVAALHTAVQSLCSYGLYRCGFKRVWISFVAWMRACLPFPGSFGAGNSTRSSGVFPVHPIAECRSVCTIVNSHAVQRLTHVYGQGCGWVHVNVRGHARRHVCGHT